MPKHLTSHHGCARLIRFVYTVGLLLALPMISLRHLWRSRHQANALWRWLERFAVYRYPRHTKPTIWVHAVSLGEANAAIPLIKALRQRHPSTPILVTTTTHTGAQRIQSQLAQHVTQVYAPYDLPWCIRRMVKRMCIRQCIIMETEIWPNLLACCLAHTIPVYLANARLSAKSAKRYAKIHGILAPLLPAYKKVLAQSEHDASHLAKIGFSKKQIIVAGNLKYDMQIPADALQRGCHLKQQLGHRMVWVAASTHAGEDNILLDAFEHARQQYPDLCLILVPRHPERFDAVIKQARHHVPHLACWSKHPDINTDTALIIGDTIGDVMMFYAAADIAFVGGSLVPIGGHNMIEPALFGLPIITGPHLHHFKATKDLLMSHQALTIVTDANTLGRQLVIWMTDDALRQCTGAAAKAAVAQHRGALQRHLAHLDMGTALQ